MVDIRAIGSFFEGWVSTPTPYGFAGPSYTLASFLDPYDWRPRANDFFGFWGIPGLRLFGGPSIVEAVYGFGASQISPYEVSRYIAGLSRFLGISPPGYPEPPSVYPSYGTSSFQPSPPTSPQSTPSGGVDPEKLQAAFKELQERDEKLAKELATSRENEEKIAGGFKELHETNEKLAEENRKFREAPMKAINPQGQPPAGVPQGPVPARSIRRPADQAQYSGTSKKRATPGSSLTTSPDWLKEDKNFSLRLLTDEDAALKASGATHALRLMGVDFLPVTVEGETVQIQSAEGKKLSIGTFKNNSLKINEDGKKLIARLDQQARSGLRVPTP